MIERDRSQDVVIINDGLNPTYDIDHAAYPDKIVFARKRRLRPKIWPLLFFNYPTDRPQNYLEIGCQEGSSVLWFLDNILLHPESRVTVVDNFAMAPITRVTFEHNMRVSGYNDRVKMLVGNSGELLRTLPLYSYDLIYLDGLHSAYTVIEDTALCWRLLKNGGMLIFDDYGFKSQPNPLNRPGTAIDLFLYAFQGKYELLVHDYQVVIRKTYPDGAPDMYI
jgi:cephalosporin hydroxylase